VDGERLLLNGELLLSLPPLSEQRLTGVGGAEKRNGATDLAIRVLEDRARPLRGDGTVAAVCAHPEVPYRMLVEVLYSLGHVGFANYDLEYGPECREGVRMRGHGRRIGALAVLVVDWGHAVKLFSENVGTGCAANGEGIAIPKRQAAYDYERLSACLRELRQLYPEEASARNQALDIGYVAANPDSPFSAVWRTVLALRDAGIPNVNFKVSR
jgi:DNA-binding transcriptional LysR family regulator